MRAELARRPSPRTSTAPARPRATRPARSCCAAPAAGFEFARLAVHAPDRTRVQPKLEVSQPGDAHEQEADRIADEVMRMSDAGGALAWMSPGTATPGISRKCGACAEEDERAAAQVPGLEGEEEEEETGGSLAVDGDLPLPDEVPTVFEDEAEPASPAVAAAPPSGTRAAGPADLVPGAGRALDPGMRAVFEPRFGFSFDRVRVHADDRAAVAARSLGALAYTVGPDIVFGAGRYAPGTTDGQRLLAHELAHVVQQEASLPRVGGSGAAGAAVVARAGTVGRAFVQRWTTGGTAPTTTNTIVCDGSGGVRVQIGVIGNATQTACLVDCVRAHENSHRSDALASNATVCDGKADRIQVTFSSVAEQKASEITASDAEISCLNGKLPSASTECKPIIQARITQITAYRDSFK
jgi:hypothetical protein